MAVKGINKAVKAIVRQSRPDDTNKAVKALSFR